jgi:predicted RNA polymerase sigma factor
VAALERWPRDGVPDKPAAWLVTTARHRALDLLRRRALHQRQEAALGWELETQLQDATPDLQAAVEAAHDAAVEQHIDDDLLRLILSPATRYWHPRRAPR